MSEEIRIIQADALTSIKWKADRESTDSWNDRLVKLPELRLDGHIPAMVPAKRSRAGCVFTADRD